MSESPLLPPLIVTRFVMEEATNKPGTTPLATAHAATTATTPTPQPLDVPTRLYFTACPDCGVTFAIPADAYLHRIESKGSIYCPIGGHPIELSPASADADLYARYLQSLRELRQRGGEIQELKNELARRPLPADKPIDAAELKRRIQFLIVRAERAAFGQTVCRFCGNTSRSNNGYKQHLKRNHPDEIGEMDAGFFA
ncbi:MAG: hypothetical protein H0X11_09485 [Betaproteobacteria bacterium]|nr:hypothetical protein [Betaproteobacteria bacterium]